MKDLLRVADLSRDDLDLLLSLSSEIKRDPFRHTEALRGELVALYFAKPSTRTRFSFEAAVHRMGGSAVSVGPDELQLGRGETIEDTARTLSHFVRLLVVRTHSDAELARFARAATIPVINALTDLHHPCQALADLLTLRERFGSFAGRKVAYIGDGSNVCHSLMEGAALAGLSLSVATPLGYEPDPRVADEVAALAARSGAVVTVGHDPGGAVEGASAVYTDTWRSMHVAAEEHAERESAFARYQVDEALLARAAPGAIFMHCLPAHRGEEVAAEVIDGPRSVVFDQVENRGHTEHAVMLSLLERRLAGAIQRAE